MTERVKIMLTINRCTFASMYRKMSFKDLGLKDALLRAVREKGYTTPSPIQEKAIPHILAGKDVLASAQTGTGKTAGFTLPVIQYLSETKHPKYKRISCSGV